MNIHTELVAAALAAVLNVQLPWYPPNAPVPEAPTEREARLGMMVDSLVTESEIIMLDRNYYEEVGLELVDLVAMGLAQIQYESYFAWESHSGKPWKGRPKPRGDKGRAICSFQLQKSASMVPFKRWRPFEKGDWALLEGLSPEATTRCMRAGMRALAYHGWRCRKPLKELYRRGEPKTRTDRKWVIAHIYRENWTPRPYASRCSQVSASSLLRAGTYMRFRDNIERTLVANQEP